jgi:hypothetical protein
MTSPNGVEILAGFIGGGRLILEFVEKIYIE